MAKKSSSSFICSNCEAHSTQWIGRCNECGEWNSFKEEVQYTTSLKEESEINQPKSINEIESSNYLREDTGIKEFDRVVGGGLVKGSLILIGGEPGIGKSTLLTEVLNKLANKSDKNKILYVSGEESCEQVAARAKRIGIKRNNFLILNETSWQNILSQIKKKKPKYLVIDSIQTTVSEEVNSSPGSISQVREVTHELMNEVKHFGITCFVIGHITKEGTIAGPKLLEHMVDTVIYFEGDQFGEYRILRPIKNRFGNINEVGIFEMSSKGLKEVNNPAQYFLEESNKETFGKSITCIKEGTRSIFVEIQSLVVENKFGNGRRITQGIDNNRVSMMIAIIEKYLEIPMNKNDIYVNIASNIKLVTRDSDLAIVASLISSYKKKSLSHERVFLAEVSLSGEIRSVVNIEMRLKEMEYLNYKEAVVSKQIAKKYRNKTDINLIGASSVNEVEDLLSI